MVGMVRQQEMLAAAAVDLVQLVETLLVFKAAPGEMELLHQ
jgi:hypothetical protein